MDEERAGCISVIVPIYNMSAYLDRCIKSIIAQTYRNLEIMLINDGSIDDSGLICEKYQKIDERVTVYHKKKCGLSEARNIGIKQSHGQYIAFVDADDWIEDVFFEKLIRLIEGEHADIACVGFEYTYDDRNEIPKKRMKDMKLNRYQGLKQLCENRWFTSHLWNKLYRRKIFYNVEFPYGKAYEDTAVMHELIMNANCIICSSEILYHYYMRSDSIIHVQSSQNELDNFHAYLRRFRAVDTNSLKRRVLKCCAWSCYNILFLSDNQFDKNDYDEVLEFWRRSKNIRFLGIKYYLIYRFPEICKKIWC